MFSKQNQKINKKGFTLIEIMVAVSIFSLVMVVALGAILAIVNANKKAQALHNVINNLNLAIETMTRDLRTGFEYTCSSDTCSASGDSSITFKSSQTARIQGIYDDQDVSNFPEVTYYLGEPLTNEADPPGYIYKQVENETPIQLTSDGVDIDSLKFFVKGEKSLFNNNDTTQPQIFMIISGKVSAYDNVTKFNIQTLVSQRLLDF